MIEVRQRCHGQLALGLQLEQQVRQRNRVGPARQRHERTSAARQERMPPNRTDDPLRQIQ